jgi:tyrosine decarboxylase / aspartate 1-decarboxylase
VLARNLDREAKKEFESLGEADSIVIDPHKHGLQPYGCGCILFKDPSVGAYYKHDSPYTYFSSPELHLGEISLECSRPGASAAALWATQRLLPMVQGGEFAIRLEKSRHAALMLYDRVSSDKRFKTIMHPALDIVVWAPAAKRASEISEMSKKIFETAARKNLHLAIFSYPSSLLKEVWKDVEFDTDNVTCLRSVLMKPEHLDWMDKIWAILDETMKEVG